MSHVITRQQPVELTSILGPAIRPLPAILLISAVVDIEIKAHWVPIEENVTAVLRPGMISRSWLILGFKDQVFTTAHLRFTRQ